MFLRYGKYIHRTLQHVSNNFRQLATMFQNIFRGTLSLYTLIVLASVFGGGSLIRLYGETCGLSILSPGTWFQSFVLIGSPWCRTLNWLGHMATMVMEYIWFHLATMFVGWISAYIPNNMFSGGLPGKAGHSGFRGTELHTYS